MSKAFALVLFLTAYHKGGATTVYFESLEPCLKAGRSLLQRNHVSDVLAYACIDTATGEVH